MIGIDAAGIDRRIMLLPGEVSLTTGWVGRSQQYLSRSSGISNNLTGVLVNFFIEGGVPKKKVMFRPCTVLVFRTLSAV